MRGKVFVFHPALEFVEACAWPLDFDVDTFASLSGGGHHSKDTQPLPTFAMRIGLSAVLTPHERECTEPSAQVFFDVLT